MMGIFRFDMSENIITGKTFAMPKSIWAWVISRLQEVAKIKLLIPKASVVDEALFEDVNDKDIAVRYKWSMPEKVAIIIVS